MDGSVLNRMCFQVAEQASGQETDEWLGLGDRQQEFPLGRPTGDSESAEPFSTRLARSVSQHTQTYPHKQVYLVIGLALYLWF